MHRFPYVDVFSPPSDPGPLVAFLTQGEARALEDARTADARLGAWTTCSCPQHRARQTVSVHVPVVLGCSHACTFCIIPYRRGGRTLAPGSEILAEVTSLAAQGVKEVTLLGRSWTATARTCPTAPAWPACCTC